MNSDRLIRFNPRDTRHSKDFIGVLRVFAIAATASVIAFGCVEKKCFEIDYGEFVDEYGDTGDARYDKFCKDKGYDEAYGWSHGFIFRDEICCQRYRFLGI
ncbi:MAG: hypothetical protein JSV52_10440 [Candidatus Zixiibacteriota bacterium]|nr:MAG: hypothetical protein JSV52_10440 [candidate division Zixibacteria bacterium]